VIAASPSCGSLTPNSQTWIFCNTILLAKDNGSGVNMTTSIHWQRNDTLSELLIRIEKRQKTHYHAKKNNIFLLELQVSGH
jgi:hypothetical protein